MEINLRNVFIHCEHILHDLLLLVYLDLCDLLKQKSYEDSM